MSYAGDLGCTQSWALLKSDAQAQLVDVRTSAEWNFVGLPDTAELGREPLLIEWQRYPDMAVNAEFVPMLVAELERRGSGKNAPLLFICRSGARSQSAAIASTRAGYSKAYNIIGGFEGGRDEAGHRGKTEGWKFEGLPWAQR